MDEPANGVTGYNNALAALGSERDFDDMFADWVCANYLDAPELDEGQYGYVNIDLPSFNAITKNTYPVPPTNGSVNRYATDYVKFIDGLPQRLWFDGTDYGTWRPRVMFRSGGVAHSVYDIPLDAADYGTLDLFDFGETIDEVILAMVKYSPGSFTSYQYGTEDIPAGLDDASPALAFRLLPGAPNPLRQDGVVRLELSRTQEVSVSVFDPSGRIVRELVRGTLHEGTQAIAWDGSDAQGRRVPAGVYFVRARGEGETSVIRWVRVE